MSTNKESRENIKALRERFLDGEKLSVKEIVEDYFTPKSPYAFLVNEKQVKGYLQSVKKSFKKKDDIWFGCLDKEGNYGIATTVDEVRFAVISYYRFVKGNIYNAGLLVKNARANGILPSGLEQVKMLMPNFDHKEKNENKSK